MAMTQPTQYLFDGQKAVPIASLPDSAFTWYTPHTTEEDQDVRTYSVTVPWLKRGVKLRAQAVASLPFALVSAGGDDYDTSKDWQNKVGFLPNPSDLLERIEKSLTLLGRAYLFRSHNRSKALALRYLSPLTVEPVWAKGEAGVTTGLAGFTRNVGGHQEYHPPEDIIHFWMSDTFVEAGAGDDFPAAAALMAAGVLYNVDQFAAAFFERGAIKVTLLTVKGNPGDTDKETIKSWWRRVFSGKSNAWKTDIVQADTIEPVVVGEGIEELTNSELVKNKREDIATALGVPQTKLWSSTAGGLGGSGVVTQDDLAFYKETVVPEATFIQSVLNEQMFQPLGLRWEFRPETLDVFQADENMRSKALLNYTQAGMPLEIAGPTLGIELPEGVTWEQIAREKEDRRLEASEQFQSSGPPQSRPPGQDDKAQRALLDDLRKWGRKATKAGGVVPFDSDHIPAALMQSINASIELNGVGVAFEFLKKKRTR